MRYVRRFLGKRKMDLAARKSSCQSTDPEFAAKAAEIVGLSHDTPENALVLAVDEKPSMQALGRRQGYLKLPNGRSPMGPLHDYTRHGTTTLFAAFDIATGKVTGRHDTRRRRVEFLDFMNPLVARHPGGETPVILDNPKTHKPNTDRWLKRRPNVRFHFTLTAASWLNQVEIWFSMLAGKSIQGASFNSLAQLKQHIDDFISTHNETARPFQWTGSQVQQKRLKPRFANQRFRVLEFGMTRQSILTRPWRPPYAHSIRQ